MNAWRISLILVVCLLQFLFIIYDTMLVVPSSPFDHSTSASKYKVYYVLQPRLVTVRPAPHRIVVLGSGPTALGALYKLHEMGFNSLPNVQIIVLEEGQEIGKRVGASSIRDDKGFLWDNVGHVVFGSRYEYFTQVIGINALYEWNERKQASFALFIKGKDNKHRFIPYPVQGNALLRDTNEEMALAGIKDTKHNDNNISYRFPKHGGAGAVWRKIAKKLPESWFHYRHKMVGIDIDTKSLTVSVENVHSYNLHYDVLINTEPLDRLINMAASANDGELVAQTFKTSTDKLTYVYTHLVGLGLKGQPPSHLQNKSVIYFPDSGSPFYLATVFSSYADDNVPNEQIDKYWSLMCEFAQPKADHNTTYWSKDNLIEETIKAMVLYGYIKRNQVVSRYYYQLDHGYPVPSIARDEIIKVVQPWLESKSIYSRGRFGGWKYEVGNQDHSFMQGVELADLLYMDFNWTLPLNIQQTLDYEFVFARYNEDISRLLPYANHSIIYNKGPNHVPDFRFRNWKNLPNIGREGHTILHHIVTRYDSLADVTVFMQAGVSSNDERRYCFVDDLFKYIGIATQNGFAIRKTSTLEKSSYHKILFADWKSFNFTKSNYTFQEYWKFTFGSSIPSQIKWSAKSCFGVTRERIRQREKSFYERSLESLSHSSNPQEGHYAERMWFSMFSAA